MGRKVCVLFFGFSYQKNQNNNQKITRGTYNTGNTIPDYAKIRGLSETVNGKPPEKTGRKAKGPKAKTPWQPGRQDLILSLRGEENYGKTYQTAAGNAPCNRNVYELHRYPVLRDGWRRHKSNFPH